MQGVPSEVEVGPSEAAGFTDFEAAAVHEPQQELVAGGGGGGEYLADLAGTENLGEMVWAFGGGELMGEGLATGAGQG